MPVFEPSTWAEVEEAIISQKPSARTVDAFVDQVRAFTNAPERFLTPSTTQPAVSAGAALPPYTTDTRPTEPSSQTSAQQSRDRENDTNNNNENNNNNAHFPNLNQKFHNRVTALPRLNRGDLQFDDLLGHGRIDLDAQAFVRRYATPTQFKSLSMFPPASTGRHASHINPSTPQFDPAAYLAKVHVASTVEQLVAGRAALASVKELLDAHADQFRSDKFVSAALVEAAFEGTKKELHPISPFTDGKSGSVAPADEVFREAEGLLKARYEVVLSRETKLSRLQRALAVYNRFQWVFHLGARLRAASIDAVADVEDCVREYQRARKWLDAQDGFPLPRVVADLESGFQALFDALLARLSSAHAFRSDTARLVNVLSSAGRDDLLTEALSKRAAAALDALQKALRSVDLAALLLVRGATKMEAEVADLVSRASAAFVEGVTHVWRLGRVLAAQDRWTRPVESQLAKLCGAYAQVLRDHLLSDASLLCGDAVREVARVRARVSDELAVPPAAAAALDVAAADVVDAFLRALTTAVRADAEQAAAAAVRGDSVGVQAAQALFAIVADALVQADGCAVADGTAEGGSGEALGVACAEAPAVFAREIYERMMGGLQGEKKDAVEEGEVEDGVGDGDENGNGTGNGNGNAAREVNIDSDAEENADNVRSDAGTIVKAGSHSRFDARSDADTGANTDADGDADDDADGEKSIKVAVCCGELLRVVVDGVVERLRSCGVIAVRAAEAQGNASRDVVRGIQAAALRSYVMSVGRGVRATARGLVVAGGQDRATEAVNRTVPIKIEGVSKVAFELTLQLALVMIATRRQCALRSLVRHIVVELIRTVGDELVRTLSTDKLAYHRAAQLWVDVSFVHDMVTRGADLAAEQIRRAVDGFGRVRERAVQAVLADGFSFSVADMKMLRDSVVGAGVRDAVMVSQCFEETWAYLRDNAVDAGAGGSGGGGTAALR